MELDIHPEPSGDDEAALQAALTELDESESGDGRGAWWREGVRENLELPAEALAFESV